MLIKQLFDIDNENETRTIPRGIVRVFFKIWLQYDVN